MQNADSAEVQVLLDRTTQNHTSWVGFGATQTARLCIALAGILWGNDDHCKTPIFWLQRQRLDRVKIA